jgi:hypothetical protein
MICSIPAAAAASAAATFPAPRLHQVVPNLDAYARLLLLHPPRPASAVARRARENDPLLFLLLFAAARVPARCASSALSQKNFLTSIMRVGAVIKPGAYSSL